MTIEDAVRRLIQDTEETKRLVENEPSQESLLVEISGIVRKVTSGTFVTYTETSTRPLTPYDIIGPGSMSTTTRYKVKVPGLKIEMGGEHPVKELIYVPEGISSPVRGGDKISAKVVAEEYVKLPTPYIAERYGPVGGWKDVPPKTHVRTKGKLEEKMHAIEIEIFSQDGKTSLRIDSGRFPPNPYKY